MDFLSKILIRCLVGPAICALWDYLSTKVWMLLMESRHEGRIRRHRWGNYLTMVVTLYRRVSSGADVVIMEMKFKRLNYPLHKFDIWFWNFFFVQCSCR